MALGHGVTQTFFYTVFDYDFCQYLPKWVSWCTGLLSYEVGEGLDGGNCILCSVYQTLPSKIFGFCVILFYFFIKILIQMTRFF